MDAVAETLYEYLRDVMYDPVRASLNVEKLPAEYRELGQGLVFFADCISELRTFTKFLARGELNCPVPSLENELAVPAKALHATLKHLTWQAQQVAKGDYKQHIDYMGDFSAAFNSIIKQLEQRHTALVQEIERSRQKARSLEQSNDLFEIVTRASAQWVIVAERETGEWLFSNYPAMHVLADDEFLPQMKRWIIERIGDSDVELTSRVLELELSENGVAQFFTATIRPITWRERQSLAFVLTDVSSEHEHIRELENTAYRDTLTRQYNRHFGMRSLDQLVAEKRDFVLCFVDIDNLKYVNDRFGHNEGDKYILSVTAVLRGFSPDIIISRLGGDEFMLIAEGWDESRARAHLEALRGRLLKRNENSDRPYFYSISYGIVAADGNNTYSSSELLSIADQRMYDYRKLIKLERETLEEDFNNEN